MLKSVELARRKEWYAWWKHMKAVLGGSRKGGPAQPLRDQNGGELQADEEKIRDIWKDHASRVFADPSGHNKDPEHWRNHAMRLWPRIEGINDSISWNEVREVCRKIKRHKAAGIDCIPPEFFNILMQDKGTRSDRFKPNTDMGRVVFKLLCTWFDSGKLPEASSTSVVLYIPKKGDLSNLDNYRGISLIPISLKLLTSLVINRISVKLEERNFFLRGQAGFRTREECVAQVIALKEIVLRRK
ncbi:hypothetical protein GOP47_0031028, partial [Adiantum capillus-veneris]